MTTTSNSINLHYFRLASHRWELALTRIRQMGGNAVYTPAPWGFHEPADNRFDLTGQSNPRRNAAGFIDLCMAMGFNVTLDLTPALPAEANTLFNGVPGWLYREHPEIQAKNQAGEILPTPSPEHPNLLKYVERWYKQLSASLPPPETRAGRIQIQVQLKTNLLDYNDHVIKVQWPIWLRKQYAAAGVDALNAAYATAKPYRSVSQVSLTEPPDSPAFEQDLRNFTDHINTHAQQTYHNLLQNLGWPLVEAIDPPPHAIQINPDFSDMGQSLQWAMDAPIHSDGSPRRSFWEIKAHNLSTAATDDSAVIYSAANDETNFQLPAGSVCYRLLLNGDIDLVAPPAETDRTLPYIALDEIGETDFYFSLPAAGAPITGYLTGYLTGLLAGQTQALARSLSLTQQLAYALEPTPPSQTDSDALALSEAQATLTEANIALAKAASSIGGLEEAFATALNKPQAPSAKHSLLIFDASQLNTVREACQNVIPLLEKGANLTLETPFAVEQYIALYTEATQTAAHIVDTLLITLLWLRERLAGEQLSPSAWAAHAHIETICRSLIAGVLRT